MCEDHSSNDEKNASGLDQIRCGTGNCCFAYAHLRFGDVADLHIFGRHPRDIPVPKIVAGFRWRPTALELAKSMKPRPIPRPRYLEWSFQIAWNRPIKIDGWSVVRVLRHELSADS